jgi:2-octaprenyl-6-methoxyphenol hydroxylase
MKRSEEIAVVGGGPAGLVAAVALARGGSKTVLFASKPVHPDRRTTALLGGSVQVLKSLGLWAELEAKAAPLVRLRLVDATQRLIRTPEVLFDANELGLDAFGQNVENELLRTSLYEAAARSANLRIVEAAVEQVQIEDNSVALRANGADERFALVVGADGRQSICRRAAGVRTQRREFSQVALAMNLRHTRPHNNVSTELHTESGPFTLVPLPGERSSLVWVVDAAESQALLALPDRDLSREIEDRAHSILGRMEIDGERGSFPLAVEVAERFADRRIAFVGEAAHVLPPIGAQGLNLGIRDAAMIAEIIADARRAGGDPGGPEVMEAYETRRRPDVRARTLAVELMNRSLLSDFLPVHAVRGLGLAIASQSGLVRRALMREGLGPRNESEPRLARGETL